MTLRIRVVFCGVGLLAWSGANLVAWTYLDRRDWRILAEAAGIPFELVCRFEERTATVINDDDQARGSLPYCLFRPRKMKSGRLYPVVLYLHGAGERGNDNLRQIRGIPRILTEANFQDEFPCFVIAPQCPQDMHWSNRSTLHNEGCDGLAVALAAIHAVLAGEPADPNRVFLIGFSMGGFGAWELAAREPERFAMVVPIAGGGDPSWAERLVGVPIHAMHGTADEVVPVDQSREMVNAISAAGGSPQYEEIPGASHSCWRNFLSDSSEFARRLHEYSR